MSDFIAYSEKKKVDPCYGLEDFYLTDEDIENLKKGKKLYTTINMGEYAMVLRYRKDENRPKGHWIDRGMDGDWAWRADGRGACWHNWECSVCHKIYRMKYNICQCGADMRGDDNESGD